ncbi:MAG: hypothetical protein ACLP9S_16255 [Syntrophales bacterium]
MAPAGNWQMTMPYMPNGSRKKVIYYLSGTKEQLTNAIDIFRECGADGWVGRMEKTLAEVS